MTNWCARCGRTHPLDRMVTVVNPYRDGPGWRDVDIDCITSGDRVIDTHPDDDDAWGPDSAQQRLERGPS